MTNYEWVKSLSKEELLGFLEQVWCSGFNDAQAYKYDSCVCAVTGRASWDKQYVCRLDGNGRYVNGTRFSVHPEFLWREWVDEEYLAGRKSFWPLNLSISQALQIPDDNDDDDDCGIEGEEE